MTGIVGKWRTGHVEASKCHFTRLLSSKEGDSRKRRASWGFILSSSAVGPPNRTRDEETVRHSSRTHRGTCCPFMELLMGFAYAQLPYAALPTLVGTVGGLLWPLGLTLMWCDHILRINPWWYAITLAEGTVDPYDVTLFNWLWLVVRADLL